LARTAGTVAYSFAMCFGLLLGGPGVAQNAPGHPPKTITLVIKGTIDAKIIPKVKEVLVQTTSDPIPAGLIVLLDSPGGDGLAAVEIGRLLRQGSAHVFVTGKCASACVFIFMGGVVRQARDGALGIHRARITRLDKETKKRIDVDHERDLRAKNKLREADHQIRDYVQEMGILAQFSAAMNEIPPESMRWLTRREGKNLGVIGFDAAYLAQRKNFVSKRLGTDARDLERFTERALDRCIQEVDKPKGDFARCYRLSLT
jgi:ATP-dependent protease ClpP protease subunit